jgi:hypothetical protein
MASDLETNLVNGGISPAAAKILANAIANVASSRTDIGRRYGDATTDAVRYVDGDTRRYLLGNLDQPRDGRFRRGRRSPPTQYQPRDTSHTYADSQPASASPTLTVPSVAEGDYITANHAATDSVAQSKVGLKVVQKGGNHARLNPATKAVESVPFLVESDQEQFIDAKFEDRPDGTVLKIGLRNLHQLFTVNVTARQTNGTAIAGLVEGSMVPNNNGGITLNIVLKNLRAEQSLAAQNIWAFDR